MSPFILLQAMYIRVKRFKTTCFIQCEPTETILDIKQKLHVLIDQPVSEQCLVLFNSKEVLEDSKTLADQKVLPSTHVFHLIMTFANNRIW